MSSYSSCEFRNSAQKFRMKWSLLNSWGLFKKNKKKKKTVSTDPSFCFQLGPCGWAPATQECSCHSIAPQTPGLRCRSVVAAGASRLPPSRTVAPACRHQSELKNNSSLANSTFHDRKKVSTVRLLKFHALSPKDGDRCLVHGISEPIFSRCPQPTAEYEGGNLEGS